MTFGAEDLKKPDDLPLFAELAVPNDGVSWYDDTRLNEGCAALVPLIGVWRGHGEVDYPTIAGPHRFAQQVTIAHDGRPFLSHEARAWLLDADGNVVRPAAREFGWWRPRADGTLEFLLTHVTGIVEVFYGRGDAAGEWDLRTDSVVTTDTAKEVSGAQRTYQVDGDGILNFAEQREMVGRQLQPHTFARLRRMEMFQ